MWKMPANGGEVIQGTRDGGFAPLESPDGKDTVLAAISRLGGHNSGHSPEIPKIPRRSEGAEVIEARDEVWCARRDSNSRPIAPEAIALSS